MYVCNLRHVVCRNVALTMRIGNDINGHMNGSIVHIDEVEIDLVVKALTLAKDEPMCDIHADMIDALTLQFEAMFREMTRISQE
mgnify:CR=1 FL=1